MGYFKQVFKNADKMLLVLPLVFMAISIVMISSTVSSSGFLLTRDIKVQALSYILGFVAVGVMLLFIDYKDFLAYEKLIYGLSVAFLLVVYIPGLGVENFGSRAWIDLRFTTIQPSEFVKVTFVILLAAYLSRHREDIASFKGVILALLYAAPFIAIVLKEDLGSALVYCSIWVFMVFFAGISYKWFGIGAAVAAASTPALYLLMSDYQKQRILAFLHPNDLSLPGNYQVWQSKVAIGSGGLLGKGLFKGTQKSLKFLPVQKSDFIFAVIAEELGAVGGLILIALYGFFISRIAKVAKNATDLYGALICFGFIGMFVFQVFENIAMTMGLMPVTGITLPLVSYGGSSVLSSMLAIGLILNVSMRSKPLNF